jgi:ABC-2 type transport system permease protein
MRRILTLALKDLLLLWRDKFGLFWVIMFPLLMALFFGSIFSGEGSTPGSLRVAFVSDNTAEADAYCNALAKSESLSLTRMPLDSARTKVTQGKLAAYVQYVDSGITAGSLFNPQQSRIEVGIDPSRRAEAGYLQGLVTQAYFQRMQARMMDTKQLREAISHQREALDTTSGLPAQELELYNDFLVSLDTFLRAVKDTGTGQSDAYSPFKAPDIRFVDIAKASVEPRSSWEITFPQALQWALIGCVSTFAISIVTERTRGTLLRLRLAPITRAHILAGKATACFAASVGVCCLLMTFGITVFSIHVSSWGLLTLAVLASGACFVGIMMFISVLGRTEQSVAGAGWAILLVMSMFGGGMLPLMFMPAWLVQIGNFSPVKWSILALEGAIWRGFSLADMLLPVGLLLAIGVLSFSVGVTILVRSQD